MFSSKLSAIAKHEREELIRSQILERLRFTSMDDRFECITEAHKRTFDWIILDEENPTRPTLDTLNGKKALRGEVIPRGQEAAGRDPRLEGNHRRWNSFVQWLHGEETLY